MAKLKVYLEVHEADSIEQALGLAQEVIAMLKSRLPNTEIEGKVEVACPDCQGQMVVQGGEIVCPACIAEWEREFQFDELRKRAAMAIDSSDQMLEALLM